VAVRTFLERLSFFVWIAFTIVAISLAGIGIEGLIASAFSLFGSGGQTLRFALAAMGVGGLGILLSSLWRQFGVSHFHYALHDPVASFQGEDASSTILEDLIRGVEESAGQDRMDARVKAKAWLLAHGASLDEEDIQLAKAHFGYLLPAGWGD
jgi:hypothetical protein